MTTTSFNPTIERDRTRTLVVPTGVATYVVSSIWTVLGANSRTEWIAMLALALVAVLVVYGVVVPRALAHESAPKTALTLSGIAALLTLPAFWTGLPLVLGAAGVLVGYAGRRAARGAGGSIAALVLGALSVIGYLAIYVGDGVVAGNL